MGRIDNFWQATEDYVKGKILETSPYDLKPTESLSMSRKQFKNFIQDVKDNGIKQAINYVEHNGEKYIVNGHHRVMAAKILDLDTVPIEKVELPYLGYKNVNDLINSFIP